MRRNKGQNAAVESTASYEWSAEGELDRASVLRECGGRMRGTGLAYMGLWLFTAGYYIRPADWIAAARFFPLATIGGALAIFGLALAYFKSGGLVRTKEVPLLLSLLAWFIILVPFSSWPGGSFEVLHTHIIKFSLLSIVFINVIDTVKRLRVVFTLQAIGVTLTALSSYGHIDQSTGRLVGISPAFGNSNDLASIIAVTLPICLYLILFSRGIIKVLWACASLLMLCILISTLSRTGFLAALAGIASLSWYFLAKRRKFGIMILAAFVVAVTVGVVAPADYRARIASIFIPSLDTDSSRSFATGSRGTRLQLLWRSVEVTMSHPITGVGPGQFEAVSGDWHVSHNTFLQFSSESGIPGLIVFVLLLRLAFRNLRETEKHLAIEYTSEHWVLAGTIRASLITFMVAACFSNFGYQFFTYFLIAYTASINQIVLVTEPESDIHSGMDNCVV